jgi:hypothetical protein
MHESNPNPRGETRRHFLKKTGTAAALVAGANLIQLPALAAANNVSVSIVLDPSEKFVADTPVNWAAQQLRDALIARNISAQIVEQLDQAPTSHECVLVAGKNSDFARQVLGAKQISIPDAPESFALARGKIQKNRAVLVVGGSDTRGLVYALLELADRVKFADDPLDAIRVVKPVSERPANSVRSISRAFVSDVEDKAWFQNREFWSRYLTMLASNRFNRFNLAFGIGYDFTTNITDCYFHFAYPFLLSVPNYNVRAVPLPDAERDLNLEMLRFISDETARRGMKFQLGLWTHAYKWTNSPRANFTIEGLTPETHAPYCREALRELLTRCPNISGITFRIHGESGVPEGNYDLWKTIFDGAATCGRKVEIDMHAKGMDQGMIDVALGTGMPVSISPKFWAEHMGLPYMQGAIRPQEMPRENARSAGFFSRSSGSRSFLRYGYGDLLAENRRYGIVHRIWPGTQRVLLWGDPETAADYGRISNFCGSNGVEIFEPLFFKGRKGSGLPGGRDGYADATLKPKFDFEKYDYTYRIWGRNLFNPDGDADGWRRLLRGQFGRVAENVEAALGAASKILPLVTTAHCPSAANNNYWPEMYFNMAIADANRPHPYSDTPSPKRFGTVTPLDPEFFLSCDAFADELLSGERSGKYSPIWVAEKLNDAAEKAAVELRKGKSRVRDDHSADFRRLAVDVTIQSGLGKFFAAKFRAGVLFAIYMRSEHRAALKESLKANRAARATWTELAEVAKNIYRDDVTFGPEYFQRGHWLDRLPAMDADIADMEKMLRQTSDSKATKLDRKRVEESIRVALAKLKRAETPPLAHTPPISFRRGEAISVVANVSAMSNSAMISGLRLRYRRVNQAENWRAIEMEKAGAEYRGMIAADYADSPFPLQYYFQIRTSTGDAWLHPNLERRANGQPYFVVRQT